MLLWVLGLLKDEIKKRRVGIYSCAPFLFEKSLELCLLFAIAPDCSLIKEDLI